MEQNAVRRGGPRIALIAHDGRKADLSEQALKSYHLLPAVRGDLLEKLSRFSEARDAFAQAASLAQNIREQRLFSERAAKCAHA